MAYQFPNSQAMPLGTRSVAESMPQERLTFIRKVYSLFFVSLLLAFIGGAACIKTGGFIWFIQHPIIALVIYFAGVFVVQAVSRTPGINAIALFAYAVFTGAYFSLIALASYLMTGGSLVQDKVTRELVLSGGSWNLSIQAFGLTLAVFGGLTLFAFVSRKDFSFLGGFLFMALILLIGLGIIAMIFGFPSQGVEMLFLVAVTVVMCGYVLYDTSNIMRRYPTNMAVSAALAIYLDFIIIFIYILRILMEMQRR
ncbi:Bax inhibitor-1 family protein [Candidatus Sumerlaeota bacterium]|nr:Bax inhibitor-1 family protein [Candidatus Sumerlaeota bacterium]